MSYKDRRSNRACSLPRIDSMVRAHFHGALRALMPFGGGGVSSRRGKYLPFLERALIVSVKGWLECLNVAARTQGHRDIFGAAG